MYPSGAVENHIEAVIYEQPTDGISGRNIKLLRSDSWLLPISVKGDKLAEITFVEIGHGPESHSATGPAFHVVAIARQSRFRRPRRR